MGLKANLINAYLSVGPLKRRCYSALRGSGPRRVTLHYQVDDPYSHLLVQALPGLCAGFGLSPSINVTPPPEAAYFVEPERHRLHALRDAQLLARERDLVFPDGDALPDERLVALASRMLLAPVAPTSWLARAKEVGQALWAHDEAALHTIAQRTDVEPIQPNELGAALDAGARRLRKAGHYRGGTLHYEGEWYWGLDRIETLEARLRAEGLQPTTAPDERSTSTSSESSEHRTSATERPQIRLYFSYRSPYSYLALAKIGTRKDLNLKLSPVLPMVMRGLSVPRQKRLYLVHDSKREADRQQIPFGRICDPLGRGVERCLAMHTLAEAEGKALDFAVSATRGIWAEGMDMAQDRDLARVITRAGLSWERMRQAEDSAPWRERVEQNRQALLDLGLWGVPGFEVEGRIAWGQDRVDRVLRWAST